MLNRSNFFRREHGQHAVRNGEANLEAAEGKAVDAARLMLIAGTGVLRENTQQSLSFFLRQGVQNALRALDAHGVPREGKAARRLGMRIGVGEIGLDVEDRRTVHQIRARNMQHRPLGRAVFDAVQADRGQADGVRPEGRAGREHADAAVAAELGRTDGRRPALAHRFGELPDEPEMRVFLDAAQRVCVAVFRLENDARRHVGKAALARDAELGRKIRADARDDMCHDGFRHRRTSFRKRRLTAGGSSAFVCLHSEFLKKENHSQK